MIIKKKALVLKTVNADMTAHGGFVWPKSGLVEAPDWEPTKECGKGLHGALWGEGDGTLLDFSSDAKWLVFEADEYIDLGGKVKSPRGEVVFCGDRKSATDYIIEHGARGAVIGAVISAGDRGTATAGDRGTATAGDGGRIIIDWYDGKRIRTAVGYVGEGGIKPNTAYRLNGKGKFFEA